MKTRRLVLALVSCSVLVLAACGSDAAEGLGATCGESFECGGVTPQCRDNFCVECTENSQCTVDDPVCNRAGLCSECDSNADCPTSEPLCDNREERGECTECRNSGDCGVAEPVCDPRGNCRPRCLGGGDCDGGELCHPDFEVCVECATDDDCPNDEPLCGDDNRCKECFTGRDCGVAAPFCIDGDCEECIQNTDCGPDRICDRELSCGG